MTINAARYDGWKLSEPEDGRECPDCGSYDLHESTSWGCSCITCDNCGFHEQCKGCAMLDKYNL